MNKDKFWKLIDEVRCECGDDILNMASILEKKLDEYSANNVQKFCSIYDTYRQALNKPGIESIAYLMNHEMLTDDGFTDFKNWLIAQGKEVYMQTLENPEILADHNGQTIDGWYEFELFGYVGMTVIEKKTGDYRKASKRLSDSEEEKLMSEIKYGDYINKDMSIEEMKELFPRFTERFVRENEEYDLKGKLAKMDWDIGEMKL